MNDKHSYHIVRDHRYDLYQQIAGVFGVLIDDHCHRLLEIDWTDDNKAVLLNLSAKVESLVMQIVAKAIEK